MKWFKKYFVPHDNNDFKPHLFREAGATALFSVIFLLFLLSVSGKLILIRTDLTALVLPKVLVDYANEDRATQNFGHLAISPVLEKAAQLKANDMAIKGYFAHKSPDGHSPWYWFGQVGYDFSYAGENLAVNFTDSVDVNTAWMNSPGHKANIMNGNFTEIGIATAEGFYQGRRTVFVVQLFGRPSEEEPITVTKKSTTSTLTKTGTQTPSTTVKSATTVSETVLSESVSTEVLAQNGTNELYVSVQKKSKATTSTENSKYSNYFYKLVVSPNKVLRFVYVILASMISLTLLMMIFIESKRRHPRHILMAIGFIVIILGLLYIYQSLIFAPLLIV